MSRSKLTDAIVAKAKLPDGTSDVTFWDSDVVGFGMRIRPGGKTWIVSYRPAGAGRSANSRRMKLATVDAVKSVSEARNLARVALGKIAAGGDPLVERTASKRQEKSRLDLLIDRYGEDLERRGYVNGKVVISGLKTKMGKLLARDIREVSGGDLIDIIDRLEKAGRAGAAQDFRSRARAFFTWCVRAKAVPANPLAGYRKERSTRADRVAKEQHGRALTDAELVKVWNAAGDDTAFGRLMRFWLLTGCRRNEGAGLEWAMVDRKRKVIDLPAIFVKQGRGHLVPIASALAAVLDACPVVAGSDYVFASPRTGGRMSGWTQMLDKFQTRCGVRFFPHDLRRTFRTGLSRLGVREEVAELALGHARGDLEAIYNRDGAEKSLAKAFGAWARHVEKIVEAERVKAGPVGVFA